VPGIKLKSADDLKLMRPACAMTAQVLDEIAAYIKPGLTTRQVDEFAGECIRAHGGKSAFLGYRKYPCNTCISVNEEVVHGMGSERELLFGDIVSLDVGVAYNGFVGDTARTVAVGGCGVLAQRLMDVTERALYQGIAAAVSGNRVTDISRAVQNYVEGNGFSVVREFVGHGVGRAMHEEPQVPNFVDRKMNDKLRAGMTIAIEPMVNAGQAAVKILKDGWTVVSQDGSLSAHFEHTVLITDGEPEILTWPEKKPFALKVA
jgi:methionyl aminopeptidase